MPVKVPRRSRRRVKGREEALDSVEPGRGGRGEVEDPARVTRQPGAHLRVFVSGIVVEDHVYDLAGRHGRFDAVEETDELLVPMALRVAVNDCAIEDIEGACE